jgi:uncharacterized protein (DUF3820 family)
MPFGKHQGVGLTDVPRPYLRWLRRQEWLGAWLGAWLARAIDEVLGVLGRPARRDLPMTDDELYKAEGLTNDR